MFAHIAVRLAAMGLAGIRTLSNARGAAAALALSATLSACTAPSATEREPHPADARVPVPAASYRSVTAGYASQRPAEPQNWRERNDRAAPQRQE